jgi:pyridoxal 5'-phosphate synthase pdxT subunit
LSSTPRHKKDASRPASPIIGVLALQGDVREHVSALESLSADVVLVRLPEDLANVDALVFPGGESTTVSMLLHSAGLFTPIARRLKAGMPALGTCAGMILLARTVLDGRPDQFPLGGIDIAVRRNAFGRQIESFETDLVVKEIEGGTMHAVFIRAPIVEAFGKDVIVLAEVALEDGTVHPVVCREGRVTVASFHPELSGDARLHHLVMKDALCAVDAQLSEETPR